MSHSPTKTRRFPWKILLPVGALGLIGFSSTFFEGTSQSAPSTEKDTPPNHEVKATSSSTTNSIESSHTLASAQAELEDALRRLQQNPDQAAQILAQLETQLESYPTDLATQAITGFLSSAQDAQTELPFGIGKNGNLASHPSLRIALLDWLSSIDSVAAASYSKILLNTPTHPDEWAVALRNVARFSTTKDDRNYLRLKTEELIRNQDWQAKPSIGFLNAFDVLAHIKATESTPLLSEMVQNPRRRDLAHASFLTLNRLARSAPLETLNQLIEDEELSSNLGPMLGNMVAHADLRDIKQQELVKRYMLAKHRTEKELRAFSGVFPNGNFFVSNNLLTSVPRANKKDRYERKKASLETINAWLQDPEFRSLSRHLVTMKNRLQ